MRRGWEVSAEQHFVQSDGTSSATGGSDSFIILYFLSDRSLQ